jgi:hypothetical protein
MLLQTHDESCAVFTNLDCMYFLILTTTTENLS